jgi:hypothetical protein
MFAGLMFSLVLSHTPSLQALDLPPWLAQQPFVSTVDMPLGEVMGTVFLSDINDNGDYVANMHYGNQAGVLIQGAKSVWLHCPNSVPGATTASSLNRHGEVVGSCWTKDNKMKGFLYRPSNPNAPYSFFTVQGALGVQALGINDQGHAVGIWLGQGSGEQAFLYKNGKTSWLTLPFTDIAATLPQAITNSGVIVGTYVDTGGNYHGFRSTTSGTTVIDVPGALWTMLLDSNEAGEMIGWYRGLDDTVGGFVYANWQFYSLPIVEPHLIFTELSGINNHRQVVGRMGISTIPGADPYSLGLILTPVRQGNGALAVTSQTQSRAMASAFVATDTPAPVLWAGEIPLRGQAWTPPGK